MTGLHIGLGAALITIGLSFQWLISKRVKNQKLRKTYAWIAWIFAAIGGAAVGTDVGHQLGVTSIGAIIVSFVGLGFIVADLWDHRPDWLAFILVTVVPSFMRLAGGGFGALLHALLTPLDALVKVAGSLFGA
jgi:hypothetical protein